MSLEKQTSPKIIEGNRVWPYYESTGIPVLPKKTRCVGPMRCPAISRKGFCNPKTEHHLLFAKKEIKSYGYPYDLLVENDSLTVLMAECRHNFSSRGQNTYAIHAQYDKSAIPERHTAYRFIDESRLLRAMVSTAVDMHEQVMAGTNGFSEFCNYPDIQARKLSTVSERFIDATLKFEHLRTQLDDIEVIPDRMVQKALQDAYQKRASIREVFAEDALDRLPPQLIEAATEIQLIRAA